MIMNESETILDIFKVAERRLFSYYMTCITENLVLFANQIIDDSQAAEDVVQDCLVKFWVSKRYLTLDAGLDKYVFQRLSSLP